MQPSLRLQACSLLEANDAGIIESGFRHLLFYALGGQLMCVRAMQLSTVPLG